MNRHRVGLRSLRGAWRRSEDPARSNDPRVRELVSALATLDPGEAPTAQFRAELRAQLVAVTPRLVSEGLAEGEADEPVTGRAARTARASGSSTTTRAGTGAGASGGLGRRAAGGPHAIALRRPLTVAGAILATFAVLLGGAVWLSQRALPGDALYGLKRASENVQLSLTSGDTAKAKQYLSLADTRLSEVSSLLGHPSAEADGPGLGAAGTVSSHTTSLVTSTLNSSDADVRSAAALLDGEAVRDASTAPLAVMLSWAPAQLQRLKSVVAAVPAGALHTRVQSSADLVLAALNRASALSRLANCSCLATAPTDALGPVPCTDCVPASSSPAGPSAPASTIPNLPAGPTRSLGGSGSGSPSAGVTVPATPSAPAATHSAPAPTTGAASPTGAPAGGGGPSSAKPSGGLTISIPLGSTPASGASPSPSATCGLVIVIPGVLELNTCSGLYISLL